MTGPRTTADLAVIGAGPAGLAAAVEAAGLGLAVVVLDEQGGPGGQIWHGLDMLRRGRLADAAVFGHAYVEGAEVVDLFRAAGADRRIDYRPGSTVWRVDAGADGVEIACAGPGGGAVVVARRLVVATGAYERPVPVPGWTLPGVMTAGGVQRLLKSTGMVPEGRIVLAGAGPLLRLVAAQLCRAGAEVAALVETTGLTDYVAAAPHLPPALSAWRELREGMGWWRELKARRIPTFTAATGLAVLGEERAEGLAFERRGRRQAIAADAVVLHDGVVPHVQVTRQLECEHQWHAEQRYWRPRLDPWGRTSLPGVWVAGDAGGIGGARVALDAGRLAAVDIAWRLDRIDAAERSARGDRLRADRERELAARPLLDALFPPGPQARAPADEALVCRCECISAAEIRQVAALAVQGPNQAKAFTRAGMGPCQGRLCGLTVAEILAASQGRAVEEVGYYRIRPPLKPLTLGEIAALDDGETPIGTH